MSTLPVRNPGLTVTNTSLQIPANFPRLPAKAYERIPELRAYDAQVSQWWASAFQALTESNRQTETSVSQTYAVVQNVGGRLAGVLVIDDSGTHLGATTVDSELGYAVDGVQVIGPQAAPIANATNSVDVITQLNLLLAAMRTHGLIAP